MPRFAPCLVVLLLLSPPPCPAEEGDWRPPPPNPTALDWVRMSSGEWLAGEILVKRDDDFEFDSEDLDGLTLDWDDIAEIRTARTQTLTFVGNLVVAGPMTMRGDTIRVRTADEVRTFPRSSLLSIIGGRPSERNYWSLRGSIGVVGRIGNSDQGDFNAQATLRRDATRSRFNLTYSGNFSEVSGTQNTNNHRGTSSFDLFIFRNVFLTPVAAEVYSDRFQNIDVQYTLSAGGGVFLVRNSRLEFLVSLGAGYTRSRAISVAAGEDPVSGNATLIPAFLLEWDVTGDIDFDIDYSANVGLSDPRNTIQHLGAVLAVEVWGALDVTLSGSWDRVENPRADADGNLPVPDDFRIAFGLGVDL